MIDMKEALAKLQTDLGYKQLNKIWAKVEILLGLIGVVGGGLGLFYWILFAPPLGMKYEWPALCLLLIVLGEYLALAGHRSHLYQAINVQTAYLLTQILQLRESKSEGKKRL
jgi:hypothetical protein